MKREAIIVLFILILLIGNADAITIDMKKEYSTGETAIVKISGNILESILKENGI